jgi:UDPglucose 6-dehydrogenase
MADIAENVGADVEMVATGIGSDSRIGPKFLKTGPGFGGSCFPKDTLAMQRISRDANAPSRIIDSVIKANEARKINMARKIIKAAGGNVKGKNIGLLGIAFKANTDDIRDSSALVIIEELLAAGANVTAYDPEGMDNAKKYFAEKKLDKKINFAKNKEQVIKNNAILSIITEWDEFRNLNKAALKGKTLVDLRNLYTPAAMKKAGINYISLGRS